MFWNALATAAEENSLQKLLAANDNPPLDDVLSDPLMFQELRQGNKNLIEYLTRPDRIIELTKNALDPAINNGLPIENQYKIAHMSAEVLTVRNIDDIINAFVECPDALAILSEALETGRLNAVTSIFYNKMITHLLSRHFSTALSVLKQTDFIKKCLSCIHLGCISSLLQSLPRIPTMTEDINEMRQYLVDERLVPRLVELLDESQPDAVHENAADTFEDILRNLRDVLYSYDDKDDILHDAFLERDTIMGITTRMFKRTKLGRLNPSLLVNGTDMLIALIESSNCGSNPSHLLEGDRLLDNTGEERRLEEYNNGSEQMWRPDGEHIAETIVASRAEDIVSFLREDLKSIEPGDSWHCLLNLLVVLCDTNHLPTHHLLTAGFKNAEFSTLFDLVWRHPHCTIFHRLLSKVATFALFSNTGDTPSPLIDFFLNDCKLITRLALGIRPICVLPRMSVMCIRAFHIHLSRCLENSRRKSSNIDKIDVALKVSTEWSNVEAALNEFLEWNRPDFQTAPSSSRTTCTFEGNASAKTSLEDFESFCHFDSQADPDLDDALPPLPISALTDFRLRRDPSTDPLDVKLNENDVDEGEFEKICDMKALDDWPSTDKSADCSSSSLEKSFPVSWPGEESAENSADEFWNKRLSNGSSDDEWPTSSPDKSEKKNQEVDAKSDEWADFESAKDPLDANDSWPGLDASSEAEWPENNTENNTSTTSEASTSWAAVFCSSDVPSALSEQPVPGQTDA